MIEVLIVDDQRTVREIYQSYIEADPNLKLVGCAGNGQEAIDLVEAYRPHIVLMDIEMPVMDGLSATHIITEKYVNTNVLIITVHNEDKYLDTALKVGAKGYLKKNTPEKELINAIYSSYKGYFQLGPGLLEQYLRKNLESQSSFQEIEQLKSVILKQSKLLDSLHGRKSKGTENGRGDRTKTKSSSKFSLESRFDTLEGQYSYVFGRLNELDRQIRFQRQFNGGIVICGFVIFCVAVLGIFLALFN